MTMIDNDFIHFIEKVKRKTGIDLSKYKEPQMKRRLTTLYEKRGFSSFVEYFEAMSKNNGMFEEFLDRMTINVSEFFRNPNRWDVLKEKIIPMLQQERNRLKIWSAACSTGEEPYSLALLLTNWYSVEDIKISATDLDQGALNRAALGVYTSKALQDVPENQKKMYFHQDDFGYRIDDLIKRCVTFRQHNLLADPFPDDMDLIVCRNVMIYFTEEAKNELYLRFSKALRTGGVLFVGSTEQIFNPAQFQLKAIEPFFYQKI